MEKKIVTWDIELICDTDEYLVMIIFQDGLFKKIDVIDKKENNL